MPFDRAVELRENKMAAIRYRFCAVKIIPENEMAANKLSV